MWHQCITNVHCNDMLNVVKNGVVDGVNFDHKPNVKRCEACVYGKTTRAPIPKQGAACSAKVLDLVHIDVCGPFPVPSIDGSRYFVSFVDDHTRIAWIHTIQSKSDVFDVVKQCLAMVENMHETKLRVLQTDKKLRTWMSAGTGGCNTGLKILHSDNGGANLLTRLSQFLCDHGIQHRITAPYNPHQNGVGERLSCTLVELVRSMFHENNLPEKFWADALSFSVHERTRVITRGHNAKNDSVRDDVWSKTEHVVSVCVWESLLVQRQ